MYAVRLFALGAPVSVHVDDYVPLTKRNKTLFAHINDDNALWSVILEKAFAKLHGTYESIVGGSPISGIANLSGSPGTNLGHDQYT